MAKSQKDNGIKQENNGKRTGYRFKPGNKFGGRTKGARNKLNEQFLQALHDDCKRSINPAYLTSS